MAAEYWLRVSVFQRIDWRYQAMFNVREALDSHNQALR